MSSVPSENEGIREVQAMQQLSGGCFRRRAIINASVMIQFVSARYIVVVEY